MKDSRSPRTGLTRRKLLQTGAAAAALPLFNINHAWSADVAYDGGVFDAGGATLRVGEWGGPWGDLVSKYLLTQFQKDFNCKISYDSSWPWFPKFVAGGAEKPPLDITNWNLPEMFKTAKAGDFFLKIDEVLPNVPNGKHLWPFATANGVGVTWAFGQYGYAYRTDLVKTPPAAFKDLWKPEFAGKRGTYITSNTLQMDFFLVACSLFGKDQYDLEAGYQAMKELMPAKISDFTGNMQSLMERGEVIVAVLDDAEPMQARDKGAPFAFWYWTEKQPVLTQTYTVSRYADPVQKKLAFALLDRALTADFLTPMGKEFYIRPTISNMELPPNLVRAGVKNSADAIKDFWIPDWNAYLANEDDIVEKVNGIFAG
ncbi:ABC transporter substrate-binding protein [Labrys wisconsinensis]|uniref:Spermidine/putrescine transport system substrate-binding protein n=1 Tax=Labrys wisconsinensis TaxID=425677 RepID=A0ABU0J7J8_9HYPH|nr:ABC transporter substrate-binding protein [Labrys wisconsinensis]MDQ0469516.1 putative spermidine/putrescine transport system substrate-binding protein [Labrys wisconsinensis]